MFLLVTSDIHQLLWPADKRSSSSINVVYRKTFFFCNISYVHKAMAPLLKDITLINVSLNAPFLNEMLLFIALMMLAQATR